MHKKRVFQTILFSLLAILAVIFPYWLPNPPPQERDIFIQASSYEYSPGTIHVNPGDQITLILESQDVVHGLYLDGYEIQIESDPGQISQISFTADQLGAFRFRCSTSCGALHPFMIGKLYVGPNILFYQSIGAAMVVLLFLFFRGNQWQTSH